MMDVSFAAEVLFHFCSFLGHLFTFSMQLMLDNRDIMLCVVTISKNSNPEKFINCCVDLNCGCKVNRDPYSKGRKELNKKL